MSRTEQLLCISKELLEFVDNKLTPKITKRNNSFEEAGLFLFAKSTKTFRAIYLLCNDGYGEDAAILGRSILENLINLTYINKEENEHRAELFILYSLLDNKQKVDAIKDEPWFKKIDIEKEFNDKFGKGVATIQKMYEAEYKKIKASGRYPKKYNWSCLSLKDMAVETGFMELYYSKVYWLISQFSHPHVGGSKGYFYENQGNLIINDIASQTWLEESLVFSFDCYLRMVNLINGIFKLNLEKQIKLLTVRYLKIHTKSFPLKL